MRKVELNLQSGISGAWKVAKFTVTPQGAKFHNIREIFNGRNRLIDAGEYWGLFRNGKIIMSNTPAEINAAIPDIANNLYNRLIELGKSDVND